MRIILDISKEKFEYLDLMESTTIFKRRESSVEHVEFYITGVTFLKKHKGIFNLNFDESNLYLAGIAKVIIQDVISIASNVDLLTYESPYVFDEFLGSSNYYYENESESIENAYNYEFETTLMLPFGRAEFTLRATGKVFLQFDTNDLISASEYVRNPVKYSLF